MISLTCTCTVYEWFMWDVCPKVLGKARHHFTCRCKWWLLPRNGCVNMSMRIFAVSLHKRLQVHVCM